MPGINNHLFGRIDGVATKNNRELADELGTHAPTISAIKSGDRGMSPEIARAVAMKSGEKAGNLYLESAVAALEKKITTKKIKDENVLGACQSIMRAVKGQLRGSEFDRSDPDFLRAAEMLRLIATAALDMADSQDKSMGPKAGSPNDAGYPKATGDSVAVALKSTRDAHGKAIPEGETVERDAYGRRIK